MSRVGKKPIELPKGVTIAVQGRDVTVKGPKGELRRKLPDFVDLSVSDSQIVCQRQGETRKARAMHGLTRALVQNMVTGVEKGFTRTLEINGVGYRADTKGSILQLTLGYSHPIEVVLPKGIEAKIDKNQVSLWGVDKEQLGQLAAVIREQRPPEPYKGKGIKYLGEHIQRKVGKAGASAK